MGSDGEIGAAGLRGSNRLRRQRGAGTEHKRVNIKSLVLSLGIHSNSVSEEDSLCGLMSCLFKSEQSYLVDRLFHAQNSPLRQGLIV